MATNATVLIIVAAIAVLVLVAIVVVVWRKTGSQLRRQKTLEIESAARSRTHATYRAGELQLEPSAYRNQAVTSSDQLNEQRVYRVAR
ncbi:MAG TPA: hypothetical protein VJR50_18095 [Mycobacterium sp.]|jgi:FtsZ-interacting cell division protein ZipA|nr:hypothetical protein [Mycobacterium sp.]